MGGHNRTCPSLRWAGLDDDKFMRETCVTGGKGETGRTDDGSRSEVRGFRNFELCVPLVSLGVPFSPVRWI
jgi:hypothetical protein